MMIGEAEGEKGGGCRRKGENEETGEGKVDKGGMER